MRISRRIALAALILLPACSLASGSAPAPSPALPQGLGPRTDNTPSTTSTSGGAADVTTPSQHLGRPLGVDFQLADWSEVSSYYIRLGEESPNVVTSTIGETTEGRDFVMAIISDAANLANLDQIKTYTALIADPRGRTEAEKEDAIVNGKVVLLISPQMHSTEAGGTQAIMEFAHLLATSEDEPWVTARQNMVVGIFGCTNPDGLDHVVNWYRETVGTPHEATGMLKLYQYYAGHDNNRDWFMLTQNETRIVTNQLYHVWHPQVYWDVHQQGNRGERMFVPPFRDPLNPNLDPAIISGIDALGSRALLDMTRDGLSGIATGVTYDMWWNGGNRNVPVRHNIIGLLTEAASVNLASPIFQRAGELSGPRRGQAYAPSNQFPNPWPGGWWRLRDIIKYEVAFGKSLVGSLGREPQVWLRNALEASERTIAKGNEEGPRAWVIPSDNRDPDAVRRLVDVLLRTGVEVHVSPGEIIADGRTYPAGSIVIQSGQPYGSHVKDLLEVQRYPDGAPPYDVAGWTLPFLLGVRRVAVMEEMAGALREVADADEATAGFSGDGRGGDSGESSRSSSAWTRVFERLAGGDGVSFIAGGANAGLFEAEREGEDDGAGADGEDDALRVSIESMPRVGLYAPWQGNMDEGWMRYVFDTFELPYVRVRNEQLRAGQLSDFLDVLIVPSIGAGQLDAGRSEGSIPDEFAGGLDPEGAVAVEEFVRGGGRLITLGSSSQWAIDLMQLPLVDVTRGEGAGEFNCPGSVLRGVPASDATWTADLPDSIGLFFSRSGAWREMTEAERKEAGRDEAAMETLLQYAPTRVLLSGWIKSPEVIEGRSAWVRAVYGDGDVHLFAFRPQYRGWSQSTFQLIFRAILFGE